MPAEHQVPEAPGGGPSPGHLIKVHLKEVAGGETYAEASVEAPRPGPMALAAAPTVPVPAKEPATKKGVVLVGVRRRCRALDQLFEAVKPSGVIVVVSIWGHRATIDMQRLVLKEVDLRGTIAYVRDHPATIELVRSGKVDLKPFITARIALDDLVEQGIHTLIDHNDTAVKILVHP